MIFAQSPAERKEPVHFQSDALDYQESEQIIVASGNVLVSQSSYTFHSDHAIFNLANKSLDAWGSVKFTDAQGNELRAKTLNYSAENGSARLVDTEGSFGPFLFAAKRVSRDEKGSFLLEKAKLTTCETDLSKYHLYGQKINLVPQKHITVQNALFRVGPIPVLYLPYYYYSLGEKHIAFQIFPGSDQSEGIFLRTIWGYAFTDLTYARLYLDELTRRGTGTGGEFDYYAGDKAKGSFYGYRISDQLNGQDRWNARFFHWQRFSPEWIAQINANRLSDAAFPNDFFREDFDRVVRDLRSNAAVTYQKKTIFFRLFGERADQYDFTRNEFIDRESFAPRAELTQIQSPLGFLGLQKIISLSLSDHFAGTNSLGENLSRNYRMESDGQFSLLHSFRISRSASFVPLVSVRNLWTDHPQGSESGEDFIQKLETRSTLRQSFGRSLDMDFTYLLTQRLQDNQGQDQGRESHSLTLLSVFNPRDWVSVRFQAVHNLPRMSGDSLAFLDPKNYLPLHAELRADPRRNLRFSLKEDYTLYDSLTGSMHPVSTQGEFVWGQREYGEEYFSMGASYFSSREGVLELRNSGRFILSRFWRIEGSLRTLLYYSDLNIFEVNHADLADKEVNVRREWRCWDVSVNFRQRSGVFEFFFNVELKLDRVAREKSSHVRQESEFYPWRGWK